MKPPLPDPFHHEDDSELSRKVAQMERDVVMLRWYLEWALERVEPGPDDDQEDYQERWNKAFQLVQ
jgi:hypothetical protein